LNLIVISPGVPAHIHLLDQSKIRAKRGGRGEQEEKSDSFHRRVLVATAEVGKSRCHGKSTWQARTGTATWAVPMRV
jgi:hypothetical protein